MRNKYIDGKMVLMLALRKGGMKPLLMKLSVAMVLTVAGYFCSTRRTKKRRPVSAPSPGPRVVHATRRAGLKELPWQADREKLHEEMTMKPINISHLAEFPSKIKTSTRDGNVLLPELNQLVQKEFEDGAPFKMLEVETYIQEAKPFCDSKEQELFDLRNMVQHLRERERNLETQLLEYYDLKEQKSVVQELENQLKANAMETKLFSLKLESSLADNKRLEAQVTDHSKALAELESARAMIKHLERKLKLEGEQNKEELSILQQRVAALQEEERRIQKIDADFQSNLQKLKDLEDVLGKVKTANSELQLENSELLAKRESNQILASSTVVNLELNILEEEVENLRGENGNLKKEIEQLRNDRFADAEELVYLKWVNACLRYELRDYHSSPDKTMAKDLNTKLDPSSERKAKELILEYANSGIDEDNIRSLDFGSGYYTSPLESSVIDIGECDDDSSCDLPADNNHKKSSTRSKLLNKLKKLVPGNNHQNQRVPHSDELTAIYSFNSASSSITMNPKSKSFNHSKFSIRRLKMKDEKIEKNRRKSSIDIVTTTPRSVLGIQKQRHEIGQNDDQEFPYGYKRVLLGDDNEKKLLMKIKEINEQGGELEKSELMKYAQVLQRSRPKLQSHKRSISVDFSHKRSISVDFV